MVPDNGDSTEAELMVELLTDPDVAELADDVLEWFDNDKDILDRVENIVAEYWPGSDLFATSEEGLNFLAKCEEQVRTAIEFVLMAKLKEKVVADVTFKVSLEEANAIKRSLVRREKSITARLGEMQKNAGHQVDPSWRALGQELGLVQSSIRKLG